MGKYLAVVMAMWISTAEAFNPYEQYPWAVLRSDRSWTEAEREQIGTIFEGVRHKLGADGPATPQQLLFSFFDLNLDDVDEVFVGFSSPTLCRDPAWCTGALYRRDGQALRLVAVLRLPVIGSVMAVHVEDNISDGWWVINTGAQRYCRHERGGREKGLQDPFGIAEPEEGGYRAVAMHEPCP